MYFRKIKGGGMRLYQFIGLGWVVSLEKATLLSGGDNHWHLEIKKRIDTNL